MYLCDTKSHRVVLVWPDRSVISTFTISDLSVAVWNEPALRELDAKALRLVRLIRWIFPFQLRVHISLSCCGLPSHIFSNAARPNRGGAVCGNTDKSFSTLATPPTGRSNEKRHHPSPSSFALSDLSIHVGCITHPYPLS